MTIRRKRDVLRGATMHTRSITPMLLLGMALFTGAAPAEITGLTGKGKK